MSGTSLDGLDLALCEFELKNDKYKFNITDAQTINYENDILEKLQKAPKMSALEFILFHKEYGIYIGKKVNEFLENKTKPDFIASHGHTIFHQPEKKLTFQIGDGAFIAAETGINCISDFRTFDTALGGQGAPLVPIGDKLLFSDYDFCVNLGGFANISFDNNKAVRIAYDICPVNIIANKFSEEIGLKFDDAGKIGKIGKINIKLLKLLNEIEYYTLKSPKSLAYEYLQKHFLPIFSKFDIPVKDKLRTLYEHIAFQISEEINKNLFSENAKALFTGGGVYNSFLISLIEEKCKAKIIIPEKKTIEFKEALIFAFLGLRRYENKINCLASVTGAKFDNSSGVIFNFEN